MRMIDADKIISQCEEYANLLKYDGSTEREWATVKRIMQIINEAPTIESTMGQVFDGDTINRQAAIDEIEERKSANGYRNVAVISELNRLEGYIMRLPSAQQRWIPCSERLPDHSCQTLVTAKWDTEYSVEYGFYWGEGNKWGIITNNVIAWMPLPESYRP